MTPFYKIESSVMDEMVKMDGELRSENERLRAALQRIADECTMFIWGDVARKALAHPTPQAGEQEQP